MIQFERVLLNFNGLLRLLFGGYCCDIIVIYTCMREAPTTREVGVQFLHPRDISTNFKLQFTEMHYKVQFIGSFSSLQVAQLTFFFAQISNQTAITS